MVINAPTASSPDQFVVVPAATRNGGVPAIGWSRVAMVLRSLQAETSGVVLVELVAAGQIVIDLARRSYWWTVQPAAFPLKPRVARIRIATGDGVEVPFVQEQPGKLDELLWYVGRLAFPSEPAWWLTEGDRYRLAQWPNLTELAHEPEDLRMIALLGRMPLTAAELATASGVPHDSAVALINTLDLMGLLSAVAGAPYSEPLSEPVRPSGLFARLRARLGR
jgi:hypothetical protein